MNIQENISLKPFNTFRIDVKAKYFADVHSVEELSQVLNSDIRKNNKCFVLGAGSNLLLTKDFDGLVIRLNIKGITVCEEEEDVYVEAGAGENWHNFVMFNVEKGYAGMENLSLIPGTVGASPIQNIGAYGVEMKDCFYSLIAMEMETGITRKFNKEECQFSYRESIFKNELKGKYIITSVVFKLSKKHNLKLHYGAISEELAKRGIVDPSIKDVSDVVSHIRVSKLPDPSTIGNSGSFFKNPIITSERFNTLIVQFPEIVHYPVDEHHVKLAAGWLIEQCGWKGKQIGNVGTWKNQSLVIVNHGNASGKEVYDFSQSIIDSVQQKFGVSLEREVNIL